MLALHLGPWFHLAYHRGITLHFASAKLAFIYNEIDLFPLRNTSTLVGRNFMSLVVVAPRLIFHLGIGQAWSNETYIYIVGIVLLGLS